MGLLDGLTDDPTMSFAMGLLNASGPSARPVSLGQGIAQGYQQMSEAKKAQQAAQLQALQFQHMKMQMDAEKQKMADADALRNFDPSRFYLTPQQQAISANGPTNAAAAAIPTLQPKFDQKGMIAALLASQNPALKQKGLEMMTKENAPIKLGKDEQLLDPTSYKPLASNLVQDVKNGYLVGDGKGGWKPDPILFALEKELKATSAPKVSVSPTVKVGNTFAEGVAKQGADRLMTQVEAASSAPEMAGAANQIIEALNTGKVMSGPGTTWKIAGNQIFGGDTEKLKATRATIQGMANLSLQGRQSLKGQGPITEGEQGLLQKAKSGDIDNLSVAEILLIAEGAKKNAAVIHAQGKKAQAALSGMPEFNSILPAFNIPDLPAYAPSAPPPGAVKRIGGSNG